MGSANLKNIGIGAVALIIIAGAYIFLVNRNSSGSDSSLLTKGVSAGSPLAQTSAIGNSSSMSEVQDVLTILNQLRSVSIDETIFSDPAFLALTDFHRDIAAQAKGRPNPFLPGEGVKITAPGGLGGAVR